MCWLTETQILVVEVFRCGSVHQPSLNAKDDIFKDVILHDVLEIVQLLLCVLLAEILVVEVSLGCIMNGFISLINGVITAIINKGRVIAQLGALSFT